jgi:RNA polymerase sigma-70 factor (ECF subfamily)
MRRIASFQAYMGQELDAIASLEVVSLAKGGDERSFEALLRPLLLPAYKLACVLLQNPQAAEDAVQEAALKSWRKLHQLRAGEPMQPWFFGIVANECRSVRRARWWSVLTGYTADRQVESHADAVDRGTDIQKTLVRLPNLARLVVVLYFYFDMPVEEIAVVVQRKPAAVRSQLYRAIERLRTHGRLEDLNS